MDSCAGMCVGVCVCVCEGESVVEYLRKKYTWLLTGEVFLYELHIGLQSLSSHFHRHTIQLNQ